MSDWRPTESARRPDCKTYPDGLPVRVTRHAGMTEPTLVRSPDLGAEFVVVHPTVAYALGWIDEEQAAVYGCPRPEPPTGGEDSE